MKPITIIEVDLSAEAQKHRDEIPLLADTPHFEISLVQHGPGDEQPIIQTLSIPIEWTYKGECELSVTLQTND